MKACSVFLFFLTLSANLFLPKAEATFVPENQIVVKPSSNEAGNISQEQFQAIIDSISKAYEGVVKTHGGVLSINGNWSSSQPNARATQTGNRWRIEVTGGLARLPELSIDGLTLIVCHELGHHLGGFPFGPRKMGDEKSWSADEGQADYFSTQACARKLWAQDTKANSAFRSQVRDFVKERCNKSWSSAEQQDLCYRTAIATQSVMLTMATLMGKPTPNFETPDPSVVEETYHAHPDPQCRMDTTFQASLCAIPYDESLIPGKSASGGSNGLDAEKESGLHTCTSLSRQTIGQRPSCWFKSRL